MTKLKKRRAYGFDKGKDGKTEAFSRSSISHHTLTLASICLGRPQAQPERKAKLLINDDISQRWNIHLCTISCHHQRCRPPASAMSLRLCRNHPILYGVYFTARLQADTVTHGFSDLRGDRESWSPERREVRWVYWAPQEQMHPVCVHLIWFCITYWLFRGVSAIKRTTTQQDSFPAASRSQSCHTLRCWQGELWTSLSIQFGQNMWEEMELSAHPQQLKTWHSMWKSFISKYQK